MSMSLPSKAHIGHLKKQAKRLLKALREGQLEAKRRIIAQHPGYASGVKEVAEVTLQEAQLVIAREYGIASWAQMIEQLEGRGEAETTDESGILLITNGRHAIDVLNEAGVRGIKEEWLEALHDGPVPMTTTRKELNQIRARHFEQLGWTSYDGAMSGFEKRERELLQPEKYRELQLWFEHDLYDQLQLMQLLDYLSELPGWAGKIKLVQWDDFIGRIPLEILARGTEQMKGIGKEELEIGREAWRVFCGGKPEGLLGLRSEKTRGLPYLGAAIERLCQEFPGKGNGLTRTEGQILDGVGKGMRDPYGLFEYNQKEEALPFMGDSSFFMLVDRLMKGKEPLLRLESGKELLVRTQVGDKAAFCAQRIELTATGKEVQEGRFDRLSDLPNSYWIGGCEIKDVKAPRWDEKGHEMIREGA